MNNTNNSENNMAIDNTTQMPATDNMTAQEMLNDLSQWKNKVDNRYKIFSAQKQKTRGNIQEIQDETLNQMFEILAAAGVDGSDPQQLNEFLSRLQQINPELYDIFSKTVSSLVGSDNAPTQAPDRSMSNMSDMPMDGGAMGQ